jgi:hypothetical protein
LAVLSVKKNEKRIPPWEKARILVHMQEEQRKRKLLQNDMKERQHKATLRVKRPSPLDSMDENRRRLAELKKRMESGEEER